MWELKQEQNKILREAEKEQKSIFKDVKTKEKEAEEQAKEQAKQQAKQDIKRQHITSYSRNDETILKYTDLLNIYKENSALSKYTPISLCDIVERYDPIPFIPLEISNIDIIPKPAIFELSKSKSFSKSHFE